MISSFHLSLCLCVSVVTFSLATAGCRAAAPGASAALLDFGGRQEALRRQVQKDPFPNAASVLAGKPNPH